MRIELAWSQRTTTASDDAITAAAADIAKAQAEQHAAITPQGFVKAYTVFCGKLKRDGNDRGWKVLVFLQRESHLLPLTPLPLF